MTSRDPNLVKFSDLFLGKGLVLFRSLSLIILLWLQLYYIFLLNTFPYDFTFVKNFSGLSTYGSLELLIRNDCIEHPSTYTSP